MATSSKFTASKVPGGYDVLATAPGVTGTATFTLTNTLGTPSFDVKVNVNPTSVKPGVNFTYTFKIKNTGTADSINTTATYPLPDTVIFGSASGDHTFVCGAVDPPNATTMQCTGGRIAIGETATITLVVFTPLNVPPSEVIGTNTLTVVGTADGQGTGNGGTGSGMGTSMKTVTIQPPGWAPPPA